MSALPPVVVSGLPNMTPIFMRIWLMKTTMVLDFEIEPGAVRATVTVTSVGRTGVEMEALAGVFAALLNVWDMVKYMEKDETGNYPTTSLEGIGVVEKRKALK